MRKIVVLYIRSKWIVKLFTRFNSNDFISTQSNYTESWLCPMSISAVANTVFFDDTKIWMVFWIYCNNMHDIHSTNREGDGKKEKCKQQHIITCTFLLFDAFELILHTHTEHIHYCYSPNRTTIREGDLDLMILSLPFFPLLPSSRMNNDNDISQHILILQRKISHSELLISVCTWERLWKRFGEKQQKTWHYYFIF